MSVSVSTSLPVPATLHSEYSRRAAEGRAAAVREIAPGAARIIRLPHVEAMCGVKKSFIYAEMAKGTFPRAVPLGRARGWLETEVLDWIEQRAASRA